MMTKTALLIASFLGFWQATAPTPRPSSEDTQHVLFLGDSLCAGYGLDPALAFPALIQQKIRQRGWNFEVLNAGLSGETSSGGLRRVNWLMRRRYDVLVLELGANDGLRGVPLEYTERNLRGIIDRARKRSPNIRVVIAGMMVPPNMGPVYSNQFQSLFPRLAKESNALLVPFLLEGVAGNPELNLADGIHPNAEGHKIVARNVWVVLEPLLDDMQRDGSPQ